MLALLAAVLPAPSPPADNRLEGVVVLLPAALALPDMPLFLAMLACRAIVAAFVALAGLVLLLDVPVEPTSMLLLLLLTLLMLPLEPRLRVCPLELAMVCVRLVLQ